MKSCAMVALSVALFTAKVHAESLVTSEEFSDSSCTTGNLKKVDHIPMSCQGPDSVGDYEVYMKITCDDAQMTTTAYSDSDCTEVHPNVTAQVGPLACTQDGANRYKKITCAIDMNVVTWKGFSDSSCSSPSGNQQTLALGCHAASDYDDGVWTDKSESWSVSGNVLTVKNHNTTDCSGSSVDADNTPWTCDACKDQTFSHGQITCPSSGIAGGAPRGASPWPLLAAAAALVLAAAGVA